MRSLHVGASKREYELICITIPMRPTGEHIVSFKHKVARAGKTVRVWAHDLAEY